MAQVDFYILRQGGEQARQLFACKLAEKAWRLKHTVHIRTETRADAEHLDKLLWTFRDGSFVPHALAGAGHADAPVAIAAGSDPATPRDLLINLASEVPADATAFPRIAELVSSDADCRQQSRKRFALYRDQGHELNTHKL
jgi:DNA polymerase III subunit chi